MTRRRTNSCSIGSKPAQDLHLQFFARVRLFSGQYLVPRSSSAASLSFPYPFPFPFPESVVGRYLRRFPGPPTSLIVICAGSSSAHVEVACTGCLKVGSEQDQKAMLCFTDQSVEPMRNVDAQSNARKVVFKWVWTQAVILIDWYRRQGV